MATSDYKIVKVTNYDNLKFTWWQSGEQNIANNTTTIGWKLELVAGEYGAIYSNPLKAWSVTVNGTNYSGTISVAIGNNATKTLASGFTNILHNANGAKTFNYSFSQVFEITFAGAWVGTISGSGSGTLNTIPRQATITTAPNFNDTQNPTITYNNAAGNSVTSLQACICNSSGSVIYAAYRNISKTDNTYTFELTDTERTALYGAVTNGTTASIKFSVKTVIGGNTYYSSIAKTLTLIDALPTLNPTVTDVGSVSTALTGNSDIVIRNYNALAVAANATAKKGASISSYSIKCGSTTLTTATGTFYYADNATVVFTVTDSRGNTATQTITKALIDYKIASCNLDAKIALDGETTSKITLSIGGNYWDGNFGAVENTLTVKYRIKENSGSYGEWVTTTPTINTTDDVYEAEIEIANLDYKTTYIVQACAIDKVNENNDGILSVERTLTTKTIFDWGENDFNFNVPVSINGIEQDYIIEEGTSGIWSYRKWNSGKAECRGIYTLNITITTAWGNLYVGDTKMSRISYPIVFASKPVETVTAQCGNAAGWVFAESAGTGVNGGYQTAVYNICRPTPSTASQTYYLAFNVVGNWKE